MGKITFKKGKRETGLARVAHPNPSTEIKVDGDWCGFIMGPDWRSKDSKWFIRLRVVDEKAEMGWSWVQFRARFDSEADGREWLLKHQATIETQNRLFAES